MCAVRLRLHTVTKEKGTGERAGEGEPGDRRGFGVQQPNRSARPAADRRLSGLPTAVGGDDSGSGAFELQGARLPGSPVSRVPTVHRNRPIASPVLRPRVAGLVAVDVPKSQSWPGLISFPHCAQLTTPAATCGAHVHEGPCGDDRSRGAPYSVASAPCDFRTSGGEKWH
jgi:hypothetical protein